MKYKENAEKKIPGRKTKIVHIISKRQEEILAVIKWHSAWRQYTFQPQSDTIYNTECLLDIVKCTENLNKEHKRKEKKQ